MGKMVAKKVKTHSKAEALKNLHLKAQDLSRMESEGIFEFANKRRTQIDDENFKRLKIASQLKNEFCVNEPGIDIILSMLDKIKFLQTEYANLSSKLDEVLHDEHAKNLISLKDAIDSNRQ